MYSIHLLRPHCVLFFVFCFAPFLVLSQAKRWDGGAETHHWHDADNWDPNGVPTALSDVSIASSIDSVYVNGDSEANSIFLAADLVIPTDVELRISGVNIDRSIELQKRCLFDNRGTVIIEGGQEAAIYLYGGEAEFMNRNLGVVEILGSENDGISIVNGKLVNQNGASILIYDIEDDAIINRDTCLNKGSIIIDDCRLGVKNEAVFKNTNTGFLSIRKSFDAINNFNNFSNSGTIEIVKFTENGILNDDDDESVSVVFNNQGSILIDSIGEDGIYNSGYMLNDTTGSITIQNSVNMLKSNGITNLDTFDNHGSLVIRDVTSTGIGTFRDFIYNTNLTRIVRCGMHGLLIEDGSLFRNEADSQLSIIDCHIPIEVEVGSSINCKGVVNIED